MDFPELFGESQLVLLSKIENIPCPDQFQPISITNSDYQIVMRYWVKWLMESAREVISPEQNAMFAGRSIDNAVESIHDRFMEVVVEGKDIMCGQGKEGEGQEKHNRKELKKMIYLYQQTKKGKQMICDSREKGGKTTQNKGEKDSENSVKRAF